MSDELLKLPYMVRLARATLRNVRTNVAISLAQLLPNAEILVVTTPQTAAAEVAERAGAIASQTHQQVVGVVENMSWLELPDGSRMEIFGSGGGEAVSDALTKTLGARVPLLGQIPLDTRLREAGDAGAPIVLAEPETEVSVTYPADGQTDVPATGWDRAEFLPGSHPDRGGIAPDRDAEAVFARIVVDSLCEPRRERAVLPAQVRQSKLLERPGIQ